MAAQAMLKGIENDYHEIATEPKITQDEKLLQILQEELQQPNGKFTR